MDFNVENVFFFLLVQNVRMLFKEGQKCHAILWLTPSLRLKVHKILLVNIRPVGCAGCTDLGCFWQMTLVRNLGSNFFSGPRYVVNPYCLLSDKLKTNIR